MMLHKHVLIFTSVKQYEKNSSGIIQKLSYLTQLNFCINTDKKLNLPQLYIVKIIIENNDTFSSLHSLQILIC